MAWSAIESVSNWPSKRKALLLAVAGVDIEELVPAFPGCRLALHLLRELAAHRAARLLDALVEVPDVKPAGQRYSPSEIDDIDAWVEELTSVHAALIDRLDAITPGVEEEFQVAELVRRALCQGEELAALLGAPRSEVRQRTLSLGRVEQRLDTQVHLVHRVPVSLEEFKSCLVDVPGLSNYFSLPPAERAVLLGAGEHFRLGRREQGIAAYRSALERDGPAAGMVRHFLGMILFGEGRLLPARQCLLLAPAARSPGSPVARLLQVVTRTTGRRDDLPVGSSLPRGLVVGGKYRIEAETERAHGAGVYRVRGTAEDNRERVFSLHVPSPVLLAEEGQKKRLAEAVQPSGQLAGGRHPNVLAIEDFVTFPDPRTNQKLHGVVREYVEGECLADHLLQRHEEGNPLSLREVAHVMRGVCAALDFAHGRQPPVFHRDVAPRSVLLAGKPDAPLVERSVRLMDFGVARVLEGFRRPPEDLPPDARTDVYLAGRLLAELLTFTPGGDPTIRPDCPKAWDDLVASAIHPWPRLRPQTIRDFLQRLEDGLVVKTPAAVARSVTPATIHTLDEVVRLCLRVDQLLHEQRLDEAVVEVRRAVALEPRNRDVLERAAKVRRLRLSQRQQARSQALQAEHDTRRRERAEARKTKTPTLTVGKSGAPYKTISEAIRAATPGSQIRVKPGTYNESIVIDRPVSIVVERGSGQVVIESNSGSCLLMQTSEATVHGLQLRTVPGGSSTPFAAVTVGHGRLVLDRCWITSRTGPAIYTHGAAAQPLLWRCTVQESPNGQGLLALAGSRPILDNCVFNQCGLTTVEVRDGASSVLRGCNIGNGKQGGAAVSQNGRASFSRCQITGNALANVDVGPEGSVSLQQCRIAGGRQEGTKVQGGSLVVEGCVVESNGTGGVVASQAESLVIRKCAVRANTGFGLHLTNDSRGAIEHCDFTGNTKSEMKIERGANPVVRHCTIHHSPAAGVFVLSSGLGEFEECAILANTAAGVEVRSGARPVFRKCRIAEGKFHGALVKDAAEATFVDCEIAGNPNNGVVAEAKGHAVLRRCRVNRNRRQGVAVSEEGRATVEESDLKNNGGGAFAIAPGCQVTRTNNQE